MFSLRPTREEDEEAILRALAASEPRDGIAAAFTRTQLLDQWRVDDFDPVEDSVVAHEGETVVGYGAVFRPGALAFVDPGHEARGVGSAILAWVEQRARELGRETHRQPIAASNSGARELLGRAGYNHVRSVLLMRRALHIAPAVPAVPEGVVLHDLDPKRDARDLHAADTAAFAENPDYEPESFEAFCKEHLSGPELDPTLSRVARHGEDVAGFTVCRRSGPSVGYIDLLAVDQRERGRGLGTVLLLSAFAAFADAGLHEAQLDVASDNPRAVRLYERWGMTAGGRLHVFEKAEDQPAASSSSVELK